MIFRSVLMIISTIHFPFNAYFILFNFLKRERIVLRIFGLQRPMIWNAIGQLVWNQVVYDLRDMIEGIGKKELRLSILLSIQYDSGLLLLITVISCVDLIREAIHQVGLRSNSNHWNCRNYQLGRLPQVFALPRVNKEFRHFTLRPIA